MTDRDIRAIADRIIHDDDNDLLDAYDEAREDLTERETRELALMLDLCPIHHRDIFICRDDQAPECEQHWV